MAARLLPVGRSDVELIELISNILQMVGGSSLVSFCGSMSPCATQPLISDLMGAKRAKHSLAKGLRQLQIVTHLLLRSVGEANV